MSLDLSCFCVFKEFIHFHSDNTEPSADGTKAILGGLLLRAGELAKKVLTAYSITGSRTANVKAPGPFQIHH